MYLHVCSILSNVCHRYERHASINIVCMCQEQINYIDGTVQQASIKLHAFYITVTVRVMVYYHRLTMGKHVYGAVAFVLDNYAAEHTVGLLRQFVITTILEIK